jgi:hypothetical protein
MKVELCNIILSLTVLQTRIFCRFVLVRYWLNVVMSNGDIERYVRVTVSMLVS